ncbi:lisH and WD40 domain-containing protein mahjong isoform X6 [Lycorma delicatula]|uniref:lisH and WD40 domain-containing protein mahjong isoform X6 n=1 Tax=Lycorma delicatula TaxID=130591 RepID=UPI003F50EB68
METNTEIGEVLYIFRQWEEEHQTANYDPVPVLTRLAELIEAQAENYMKMDPDPFDERHPSRADPTCALGQMLKILFRKDNFMNKLVNDYLRDNYWSRMLVTGKDVRELNIAACRLMLDIMPGLETSAVFETPTNDALVHRLYNWAEKSSEPLQTYATGLLAAAMEVQDIAAGFREENGKLVPLMLERLHALQSKANEERHQAGFNNVNRPFAHFGRIKRDLDPDPNTPVRNKDQIKDKSVSLSTEMSPPPIEKEKIEKNDVNDPELVGISSDVISAAATPPRPNGIIKRHSEADAVNDSKRRKLRPEMASPPHVSNLLMSPPPRPSPFNVSDCSNSSWAEMESYVIGHIQMYPPTLATQQIFILKYLTPMGEYQEFLSHVFEKNALELILQFINLRESKNSRLAFEALKYLASLLCHKKFSIEFINMQGLQRLLEVPRPSIAATGVSICLYYLAYCEDAMERVCLLPQHILSDLVRYSLWLLECSHDSGRCHATMFFGLSFQFRIILEEFDVQDGLRKLYNVMSTLPILAVEDETPLNEDEECSARQIVRHVCVALKRYLEAHLYIKAEQLRRAHIRESGTETQKLDTSLPSYKAYKSSPEEIEEQITTLLQLMSFRASWPPVDELMRLGGITLLLQVIAFAYEWNFSGRVHRAETVRSALDVLCICAVMPRVQLHLCERVDLPDETMTVGMNVILGAAEGEIVADPDVQRAALGVLNTCVCAPIHRESSISCQRSIFQTPWSVAGTSQSSKKHDVGGSVARYSTNGSAKKRTHSLKSSEEIIEKLWDCVRSNNGIMVLLTLMMVKTPITDADSIRALACQALCGLARSETVRQIISKLPLFTNGQLQNLMRDPILQDKRQEHVKFQKHAVELLERVYGKSKPSGTELEVSLAKIHRANIIAQTRIQFSDKQLFQLMHNHLFQHGMVESAMVLQREAGLPPNVTIKSGTPSTFLSPFTYQQRSPGQPSRSRGAQTSHHIHRIAPSTNQSSDLASPSCSPLGAGFSVRGSASSNVNTASSGQPIKLTLSNARKTELKYPSNGTPSRSLQKQLCFEPNQFIISPQQTQSNVPIFKECHVTLDSIITEYLTNQHALCKNPMVTCPQFNLFEPHKCPDPKAKNSAPANFTMRLAKGITSRRLDQRLVHSRFCPVKTFRLGDDDIFFTCCVFLSKDKDLMIGTHQGEVKMFNLHSGAEEATYQCHESYISNLQASSDGSLLLTSSTWRRPLSALWGINNYFELKFSMVEDDYVEFSKLTQDRIIGTRGEVATIYDIATGKSVLTLTPTQSNQYNKNRATFNPTDELVLSDGVLWDVTSGKEIHKLDKLNQTLSGVFHPNGLEIVSNTEVWDIRTFHLLRTVSSLDQCDILFNSTGSTIYAVSLERENEDDTSYETSFKTLDAYDYSSIATIDVKKNIYDLACNRLDTQIAIVENQGMFDSVQESSVRLYDVGRRRDDEDEADDEEEEDEDIEGSEDGSSPESRSEDEEADGSNSSVLTILQL